MSRFASFDEVVRAAGGVIIDDAGALDRTPVTAPPLCAAFLDGWSRYKSFGFLNGWTSATRVTALDESELDIWNRHFGSLVQALDRAGQVGIVFLPGRDGSSWYWYFAFAFPVFSGRPVGRILIQPACAVSVLEQFESRLGQPLPLVARTYYRVMGALLFAADLEDRFGIIGVDESHFGSLANETELRLGKEEWVPWQGKKPAACIGYLGQPDELWIAKDTGDRIFWVGHDPGEVQAYHEDLGALVADLLSLVDEERWREGSPRELATMGYDALRSGDYTKAIGCYLASVDAYDSKNDELGKFSALGWLSQVYRKAGKNIEALQTALTIIRKVREMGEIHPQLKVAAAMAIDEASTVLLARNRPEQVLKLTGSIVDLPKIRAITRWSIMTWTLKALLMKRDQAGFTSQWNKLTAEIYEARGSKFPPAEPNLEEIRALAKSLGWDAEFEPKI